MKWARSFGRLKLLMGARECCRVRSSDQGTALRLPGQLHAFRERNPKLFEIAVSILACILIQIAFLTFQPSSSRFVRRAADNAADQMIRLSERTSGSFKGSPKFTFFSIDDATYVAWGAHQI